MNSLARIVLLVALLVSGFSFGFAPARADELPADTNKTESLSPEQARKLTKEFKGDSLSLLGLTRLDANTAQALAEFKGNYLGLNGLTALDADVAKALAEIKVGTLVLGLTALNADVAEALAEFKGDFLSLNGLTRLDAKTAQALAEFKGKHLGLTGLTELDAVAANALAEFRGQGLYLGGQNTLDSDTAKALAEFKCNVLSLYSVTTLDADAAKALAEFKGNVLSFTYKLTTLDADAAKALAEFKGESLCLPALTSLDADTAKALAGFARRVALPDKVLEAFLAENPLTPETALAWAAWSGSHFLTITAITTFDSPDSVAIATALATRKGPLSLPNLKKLSPKTLTALLQNKNVEVPLIETLELILEPDGSATEDFVIPEWLEERQKKQR